MWRLRLAFFDEQKVVHSTRTELNWTDLQHVDPVTRRVHWSHDLIDCSKTRTVSAQSVLNSGHVYSKAAAHTGFREHQFSSCAVNAWASTPLEHWGVAGRAPKTRESRRRRRWGCGVWGGAVSPQKIYEFFISKWCDTVHSGCVVFKMSHGL